MGDHGETIPIVGSYEAAVRSGRLTTAEQPVTLIALEIVPLVLVDRF
jgi:hypothetical protein